MPNFKIMEFCEGFGKDNPSQVVGPKKFFQGKEHFVKNAKEEFGWRYYLDKLKVKNVKEMYCRYSGIYGCYTTTTKNTKGSFPVYYIDV